MCVYVYVYIYLSPWFNLPVIVYTTITCLWFVRIACCVIALGARVSGLGRRLG